MTGLKRATRDGAVHLLPSEKNDGPPESDLQVNNECIDFSYIITMSVAFSVGDGYVFMKMAVESG